VVWIVPGFYLTGRAQPVDDADLRLALTRQFLEERAGQDIGAPGNEQRLFSFESRPASLTRTKGLNNEIRSPVRCNPERHEWDPFAFGFKRFTTVAL